MPTYHLVTCMQNATKLHEKCAQSSYKMNATKKNAKRRENNAKQT